MKGLRPYVCRRSTTKEEALKEFKEWQRNCYQTKEDEMPFVVEVTKNNIVVWYKMDSW